MSATYEDRNEVLAHLASEMGPFVVGPIPAEAFLDMFLPPASSVPPFAKGMFSHLSQMMYSECDETSWYDVFVSSEPPHRPPHLLLILPFQTQIMSPHMKNLDIFNTSHSTNQALSDEFGFDLQPGCSVYPKGCGTENLDVSRVDFTIEFKSDCDPFVDEPSVSNDSNSNSNPFLHSSRDAATALGQLTAYATAVMSAQYRTHLFMVFIVKEQARLIRWDRSGAVVTKSIKYTEQRHLFEFFFRYDTADPEARGHDSTIGIPTDDEVAQAKLIVPELKDKKAFLAFTISKQRFITHGPVASEPRIPVGRWTRVSFACDINQKRRVLLKDSWRVFLRDFEPEGKTYRRLHEHKVPNIPLCLLADDVGKDDYHHSRTQEVKDKYFAHHTCWQLTPRRHYCIVLGTIGRELKKFRHTWEFVNAMHAALKGKIIIFLAVCLRNLTVRLTL